MTTSRRWPPGPGSATRRGRSTTRATTRARTPTSTHACTRAWPRSRWCWTRTPARWRHQATQPDACPLPTRHGSVPSPTSCASTRTRWGPVREGSADTSPRWSTAGMPAAASGSGATTPWTGVCPTAAVGWGTAATSASPYMTARSSATASCPRTPSPPPACPPGPTRWRRLSRCRTQPATSS